ncbi:MAG: methyltransferase domain-containing protein [Treponema sp.]|nr:methyltransferase domain-containing protein [Treponema sp.]
MQKKNILIVPATEKGRGGGHLTRCISLTNDLRYMDKEAFLFIPDQDRDLSTLYRSLNFNPKWCITNEELGIRNEELKESFDFIILDRYQTSLDELLRWKRIGPVIGIDEGGLYRDSFDFLIDILIPKGMVKPSANFASPALVIKNKFTTNSNLRFAHEPSRTTDKILITFGQEDSAGLGIKIANKLSVMKNKHAFDITLLRGALANLNRTLGSEKLPQNINVIENIPNLAEHLGEYNLVITHYGLTAYEAAFAGTPVLLAHPTKYHKKLAKIAGFKTFSLGQKLCGFAALREKKKENITLAELCSTFSPQVNRNCPVCGADNARSIARFSDRTYRRCKQCGIIYMDRLTSASIKYEKDYFFESYKKQYGKTYLEDFEKIKQTGKNRLKKIKSLLGVLKEKPSILDIGCAYGPFLAAAKEAGFSPAGIEPCEDAVKYINEKLGLQAIHGIFPNTLIASSYDVISLWLVIEHFTGCKKVIAQIRKLLKPGGILAFSTPSFSGISGRTNVRRFLSVSPQDHFTVWSPKSVKKALSLLGFKVKKIAVTGHHPLRFPLFGKLAKGRKSPFYWLLLAVSKLFRLGDTFEVYAQKKETT